METDKSQFLVPGMRRLLRPLLPNVLNRRDIEGAVASLFVDLHLYWLLHVLGILAGGENHEGEAACRNFGWDFELNGSSALLHDLYRDIILPICQEDLGNVFFLEILSRHGDHIPGFAVARIHGRHARHWLLRVGDQNRRQHNIQNKRQFHLKITVLDLMLCRLRAEFKGCPVDSGDCCSGQFWSEAFNTKYLVFQQQQVALIAALRELAALSRDP